MSARDDDAEVVLRYLRTFVTRGLDELRAVVADDVEMYGAGQFASGRHNVEAAVMTPGLTVVSQQVVELYSAGHRVTVAPGPTPTGRTRQGRLPCSRSARCTRWTVGRLSASGVRRTCSACCAAWGCSPARSLSSLDFERLPGRKELTVPQVRDEGVLVGPAGIPVGQCNTARCR
jgi:hypothetical protein